MLVEAIVTATILGLSLFALMGAVWSASMLSESSREGAIALFDLQAAAEGIMNMSLAQVSSMQDGDTVSSASNLPQEQIVIVFLARNPNSVVVSLNNTFLNHKGHVQTESLILRKAL